MKATPTGSHVSMSPADDEVDRDRIIKQSLVNHTRPVAVRKPLRNRFRAGLGIICAVALGSLVTLIGGLPDEEPRSPY